MQNEAGKHHGENLRKRRAGLRGVDRIAQENHIGQRIAKAVCRVGKPGHQQKAGRGAMDHPKRKTRVFQHGKRLLLLFFLLLIGLRYGAPQKNGNIQQYCEHLYDTIQIIIWQALLAECVETIDK